MSGEMGTTGDPRVLHLWRLVKSPEASQSSTIATAIQFPTSFCSVYI